MRTEMNGMICYSPQADFWMNTAYPIGCITIFGLLMYWLVAPLWGKS